MPDYSQGKIYKITSKEGNISYVGSTTYFYLSQRWGQHRILYKKWMEGKHNFCTSYYVLGFPDSEIELLEEFPCKNIAELNRQEGVWQRRTPNCVNRTMAGRTKKEYFADNREKLNQRSNEKYHADPSIKQAYYQKNRDAILSKAKQRYILKKMTSQPSDGNTHQPID